MKLDETTRKALAIFRALPPEGQDVMMALTKALLQQQEREEAERYKAQRMAMTHATLADISKGEAAVGRAWMAKYKTCPEALVGLAYTAGVAEGKRIERARRRAKRG